VSFEVLGEELGNDKLDKRGELRDRMFGEDRVDRTYGRRASSMDRGGGDNIFDSLIQIEFDYKYRRERRLGVVEVSRSTREDFGGTEWSKEFSEGYNLR